MNVTIPNKPAIAQLEPILASLKADPTTSLWICSVTREITVTKPCQSGGVWMQEFFDFNNITYIDHDLSQNKENARLREHNEFLQAELNIALNSK